MDLSPFSTTTYGGLTSSSAQWPHNNLSNTLSSFLEQRSNPASNNQNENDDNGFVFDNFSALGYLPIHIVMEVRETVPGQTLPDLPACALEIHMPVSQAAMGLAGFLESGWLDDIVNDYMDDLVTSYFLNAEPELKPATEEDVKNLPLVTITEEIIKSMDVSTCVICQDPLKIGTQATSLPCKHLFCPECIKPWLETNRTCPLCREEIISILPTGEKELVCNEADTSNDVIEEEEEVSGGENEPSNNSFYVHSAPLESLSVVRSNGNTEGFGNDSFNSDLSQYLYPVEPPYQHSASSPQTPMYSSHPLAHMQYYGSPPLQPQPQPQYNFGPMNPFFCPPLFSFVPHSYAVPMLSSFYPVSLYC